MVKWFLSSINDVVDPLLIACLNFSLRTPCGVNHVFCKRSSGQLVVGDANLPWSLVISSKIIPSCKGTLVASYTGVNLGPQIRCKPIGIRAPLYVSVQDWSYWIPYFLPAWCDPQTMQPWGLLEVGPSGRLCCRVQFVSQKRFDKSPPRQLRQPSVYGCQWQLQLSKFWFWQPINSSGVLYDFGMEWLLNIPCHACGYKNIVVWGLGWVSI